MNDRHFHLLLFVTLLTGLVLVSAACDDDPADPGGTATDVTTSDAGVDTSTPDTAADTGGGGVDVVSDQGGAECDRNGFTVAVAFVSSDDTQVSAQGYSAAAEEFDLMELLIATDEGGTTAAGSYEVSGAGMSGCVYCLSISANCAIENDVELVCDGPEFRAVSGTAVFTSGGTDVGDTFTVTLNDAVLIETTDLGLEVEDGETWCVDDVEISYVIE